MSYSVQVSEKDYLVEKFSKLGCSHVCVSYIKNFSDHFHNDNTQPKRIQIKIKDLDKFIEDTPHGTTVAISTTFKARDEYLSFVGFDIELHPCDRTEYILKSFLTDNCMSGAIFRTSGGYHFLINTHFSNDIDLNRFSILCVMELARQNGDIWILDYCDYLLNCSSFTELKKAYRKLVKIAGHVEKGPYTVVDVRHLAYGILLNERLKRKRDDGKLRTQRFFRVTKRCQSDFDPYLIFTTDSNYASTYSIKLHKF